MTRMATTTNKKREKETSLAIQWLRLCLPMNRVQVQSGVLRPHMPQGQKQTNIKNIKNRSSIVTDSIKTLKMVHTQKKNLKKRMTLLLENIMKYLRSNILYYMKLSNSYEENTYIREKEQIIKQIKQNANSRSIWVNDIWMFFVHSCNFFHK